MRIDRIPDDDYNENRPHYSLGDMLPNEYRREYGFKNVTLVVLFNTVRKRGSTQLQILLEHYRQ